VNKPDRQHIIPQLHLRRFSDGKGKLWVYSKQAPEALKYSSPRHIAWADRYYTDSLGDDFDKKFLAHTETQAGRILRNDPQTNEDAGKICRFAIALLWRTRLTERLSCSLAQQTLSVSNKHVNKAINGFRGELMHFTASWIGRGWSLRTLTFPRNALITSDQPVYPLHLNFNLPCILLYPYAPNRCAIIGPPDLEDDDFDYSPHHINHFTIAWSHNEVYCPTRSSAEWVHSQLHDPTDFAANPIWKLHARHAHFGIEHWIRYFTCPPPARFTVRNPRHYTVWHSAWARWPNCNTASEYISHNEYTEYCRAFIESMAPDGREAT
jgi:hypothetical protein